MTNSFACLTMLMVISVVVPPPSRANEAAIADTVLVGGKIVTVDAENRVVSAIAIRDGRILAVGSDEEVQRMVGAATKVVRLDGRTVIPGIIAAHCHAVGVARNALDQPHVELLTIAAVQDWIRDRAKSIPAGTWIRVPRTDITRLAERRHPTTAELDAACTTHPVIFTAARKSALNSTGLKTVGVTDSRKSIPGGQVILDVEGNVRLIAGGNAHLRSFMPKLTFPPEQVAVSLQNVHRHYNAVGISSIFERAGGSDIFLLYRKLRDEGKLTVRMTQTFRSSFRSAKDVAAFSERLRMKTGDGDDWVRVGPLKITVDGGIHWGNTYLREPYGEKRVRFYVHKDPDYRGDLNYSVKQMTEVFREGHRRGWQWCCHVTGDAGVDAVLDALAAVHREHPSIGKRRFSLTHAYFPALDSVARAKQLGVCVDTQPSLYFKDSAAINTVYGAAWASRFIGLGDWIRGGVPTAIAGDHMMGLDPNQAMNAYNPFLMLYVAVTRRDRDGNVYGKHQRISRMQALRCLTTCPAYLCFEEATKGSLEKGKLADLAILDRDYLTCPVEEIAEIQVLKTMVNGRFVYARVEPRVFPPGERPNDTRLGPLKGESGNFLLKPAKSIDQAKTRADRIRRVMQVNMGLWPMPKRTQLNAVVHGRLDRGDHTIEKVYFESIPGFYVTGNLYRPKGKTGRRAAVLSPHGHFPGGRFLDEGAETVRKKIAQGAERWLDGGRSFMQSRCVQLARMGCVVFHYDMVGYGDSQQIPLDAAHRFSRSRVKFDHPPATGFYSAKALLNLNNQLGLHTWNSIRALDFLTSLSDVDPERIAVTGGSGGGTQTFMLCAIDDRPLVSVPVVIVSADRQGGCTCENICGLRIDTHNLDFTSLHAPKPLLLISADDATRTMATRGFPELQEHYRACGGIEQLEHRPLLRFPHNYNYVSRHAMYEFVNQHLNIGVDEPITEARYDRLTREQLTVWNDDHPQPAGGSEFEQQLLERINSSSQEQLAAFTPHDAASLRKYQEVVGGAWDVLLRKLPENPSIRWAVRSTKPGEGYTRALGLLSYRTVESHDAELPVVILKPQESVKRTVIWIHDSGKSGLFDRDGEPRPPVRRLLQKGRTVIAVDLLQQGEFLADGNSNRRQRSLPGEEAFGGWSYCYNLPLFARRVHDILAVIQFVEQNDASEMTDLIGLHQAGPMVAAAVVQARGQIDRAAVHTDGFRFANVSDIYDARFLPGAMKYGDLPGLLSLAAPTKLWLAGEEVSTRSIIRATWRADRRSDRLTIYSGGQAEREAVEWLLK